MPNFPVLTPTEEHIAFYHEIGLAITQWSHIEHSLYQLAIHAFGSDQGNTLAGGFFSIENFRSKLAFVERTFAGIPSAKQHEQEWFAIRENVRSLSSRRNVLAHSRVIIYPNAKPGRRYAIVPLFFDKPKKKSKDQTPPPGSLCVRDICLIRARFFQAMMQLSSLEARISGVEDVFAESAQREPKAQTLAQLRHLIDVTHLRSEQSSH